MSEPETRATSVLVTGIDSTARDGKVIEAVSAALGGANHVEVVGTPGSATLAEAVSSPDVALTHIVAKVETGRDESDVPQVLTAVGFMDFDARVAAATGSGIIITVDGSTCADPVVTTRLRMAVSAAKASLATPLVVIVVGESTCGDLEIGIPVIQIEDTDALKAALDQDLSPVMSPQRFQWWLMKKAKETRRHIVLPEGEDDRILLAASQLLEEDICDLTILGDPEDMRSRAKMLGADISAAKLSNPKTSSNLETFAEDFAELRKSKGISVDEARETMNDISYFATMMIHKGLADGMVSGAANTTAHTIKPSFQIIKTRPGASTVSSLFLMVMDGRLWGFADCAVLPNPTPDQLGEIAVVSAETAAAFGIDPKVAMLSYSTGASGAGEDVERVAAGLAKARELNPDLAVDGPLQFDAAIDSGVAKKKMPESDVAGQATVFVFPDLDAGNLGYKIAQRCGGALAIGPILQGLNKPVNDLSRGASVADIVNTVAITAIQAGGN